MSETIHIHASCIAIGEAGILLLGPSGSGKSDLALRLIQKGANLVADDRVRISPWGKKLVAQSPDSLRGLLEVRGIGILQISCRAQVGLILAVNLVAREKVDRLPEPAFFTTGNINIPQINLHAFDVSAPEKVMVALQTLQQHSLLLGAFTGADKMKGNA